MSAQPGHFAKLIPAIRRLWGLPLASAVLALLLLSLAMLNVELLRNTLNKMELSLLDQRIRYRAEGLLPSPEIIVVALDQDFEEYARNHPELGITSRVLPHHLLAEVVNFLHRQGVKALALDVELKYPQSDESSRLLETAIRSAGNVYVDAYLDHTFQEFIRQEAGSDRAKAELYGGYAFLSAHLLPYLDGRLERAVALPAGCSVGDPLLAFAPLLEMPVALSFRNADLSGIWTSQCSHRPKTSRVQLQTLSQASLPLLLSGGSPMRQAYGSLCLIDRYRKNFAYNPHYLALLEQRQIPLRFDRPPEKAVEEQFTFCRITPVMNRMMAAAKGFGISTIRYDSEDAILRTIPAFYRGYRGGAYSLLGIRPALDLLGNPPLRYTPEALQIGTRTVHLIDGHKIMLNWRNPVLAVKKISQQAGYAIGEHELKTISADTANSQLGYGHFYRFVSVADILRVVTGAEEPTPSLYKLYGVPTSGPFEFNGKLAIYGDTVKDIERTPVGRIVYGPEMMATALDMLLNDDKFVHRSPPWLDALAVLLLCAVTGYAVVFIPRLSVGFSAGCLSLVVFWVYNFLLFSGEALWIPLVWPTLAYLGVLLAALVYRYHVQDREKRQLTSVFSKYVSPQLMQRILSNPAQALTNLNGVKKELTVLFADLYNFTAQFEDKEPEQIVQQLNEYFDAMTRIVLEHGGTYDKYMGDSLMAFFGAPADMADHARKACLAALEMQQALAALNRKWAEEGRQTLRQGIGLSSGPMLVGNLGSEAIKNFTVIGSTVNLGARLESMTRQLGAPIIISENTWRQVNSWAVTRDLGQITVRGFSRPVRAFALEASAGERSESPSSSSSLF